MRPDLSSGLREEYLLRLIRPCSQVFYTDYVDGAARTGILMCKTPFVTYRDGTVAVRPSRATGLRLA